jgi:AraC family transcriptional regulator
MMEHGPRVEAGLQRRLAARYGVVATLASSRAVLEHAVEIGDGFTLAQWHNAHDTTGYEAPGHHTLSLYLEGGEGTQRIGFPDRFGGPGRFCLLPAEHESHWILSRPMRFLHFYFDTGALAAAGAAAHDADIRETALPDDTFFDDPEAARLMAGFTGMDWSDAGNRLAATQTGHEILAHLAGSRLRRRPSPALDGGLAPHVRRRVLDFVEAALDQPLTLGRLAAAAGLSEFHFARMFRASVGLPPHAYVLARRLDRARRLLAATELPLTDIAAACGFTHPSHLTRHFRAAFGGPPGAWRTAIRG